MILDRFLNLFEAHRRLESELQAEQGKCSFWMAQAQRFEIKADNAHSELTKALKRIADEEHRAVTGRYLFSETSDAQPLEGGRSIPAHHSTGRVQGRRAVKIADNAALQIMKERIKSDAGATGKQTG